MDHLQCYLLFPFHSDLTGLLNYRNRCPPPEEKIALVIGPIAFTKQEAYIEASTLVPIAGDPADPRYKETVPDLPYPYLIGVGHVVGTDTMSAAETSSYVNVNVTDYVKDQYMASS